MLRLLIIPFLSLYLLAAAGLQLQLHYCGSELAAWSVNAVQPADCGDGACDQQPQESDPCCSDEWIETGLINHYYTHAHEFWEQVGPNHPVGGVDFWFLAPAFFDIPTWRSKPTLPAYLSPNPPPTLALYKVHSQLLYYG